MITMQEVQERLCVTSTRLEMAIYSGYLPPPTNGQWNDSVRWLVDEWEQQLARLANRNKDQNYYSGCMTFPKHQR
jgi:hypothetical protein